MGKSVKKRGRARVLLPVAALAAGLLWAGNFTLGVTELSVTSQKLPADFDGFRIALVTDLHGRTFGPDNDWLVEKNPKGCARSHRARRRYCG